MKRYSLSTAGSSRNGFQEILVLPSCRVLGSIQELRNGYPVSGFPAQNAILCEYPKGRIVD
jgi:hypothetical protein